MLVEDKNSWLIVTAVEERRILAFNLVENVAEREDNTIRLGESGAMETFLIVVSELAGPGTATLMADTRDAVVGDVAPTRLGGINENEDFRFLTRRNIHRSIGEDEVSDSAEVTHCSGLDDRLLLPSFVVGSFHHCVDFRGETKEVEIVGDLELKNLEGPPNKTHVSSEPLPRPAIDTVKRETGLHDGLFKELNGLVCEVETHADPVDGGVDNIGRRGRAIVDSDLSEVTSVEKSLNIIGNIFSGADKENIVNLRINCIALKIEVEKKIGGGAAKMNDVFLTGWSNCHAEEFGATIGHANTNAVEVADFRAQLEVVIVSHEVKISSVGAHVNQATTFRKGLEGDRRRIWKISVDVLGVLDDTEAALRQLRDLEDDAVTFDVVWVDRLE